MRHSRQLNLRSSLTAPALTGMFSFAVIRTALDSLDDTPEIEEFPSQEENDENQPKEEKMVIESVDSMDMDLSGIDFDEEMSESSQQENEAK